MITAIAAENFKGIRDRVELQLRPITLLCGPNSSGKSTFADALEFLGLLLENEDPNLAQFPKSEREREWQFRELVNGHDRSRTMTVGVTCSLDDDDMSYFQLSAVHTSKKDPSGIPTAVELFVGSELNSISLDLSTSAHYGIMQGGLVSSPYLSKFAIRCNGEMLVECSRTGTREGGMISTRWTVNAEHALLQDFDRSPRLVFTNYVLRVIPSHSDWPLSAGFVCAEGEDQQVPPDEVLVRLNALVLGAFAVAKARLRLTRRIGAIRTIPNATFLPKRSFASWEWLDGSAAWTMAANCGDDTLCDINHWLGPDRLRTGYQCQQSRLVDMNIAADLFQGEVNDEHRGIRLMQARDEAQSQLRFVESDLALDRDVPRLTPAHLGTGVSQVFPVVVGCLMADGPCLLSISQPELHLHPRMQADLADLFREAFARHRHRIMIETHSEHLILRLQRRIRQGLTNKVDADQALASDDVVIYFVSRENKTSRFRRIDLDEKGDFVQPWPDDFFELDFYERFGHDR